MENPVHLVCLEKGCRFLADLLPDRLCPNCGGEMINEERFLSRMRPKPVEEVSYLPLEVQEALRSPHNDLGDFILVNVLGEGGAGVVYRAWQKNLRRYVAIKFLNSPTPEALRRFECEAQLAAQLRHPNIAGVHEVGEANGKPFLVMDYIDGFPIGRVDLNVKAFAEAFVKVCRGVAFAHSRSIIHRDLKPANILYENNGEPSITDFGLARVLLEGADPLPDEGIQGTPSYMSPEQARGLPEEVDQASDVYSLGATLYTLLTGRPPFEGENAAVILHQVGSREATLPRKLNQEVPLSLEAIVMKALEKQKSDRYSSAEEMAEDLERFLSDEPVHAPVRGRVERFRRWVLGNPWPAIAAAAILVALLGMGAWKWKPQNLPPHHPEGGSTHADLRSWDTEFDQIRKKISFYDFEEASPDLLKEARLVFGKIPVSRTSTVEEWFFRESHSLPLEVWPKQEWLARKGEALRIGSWCRFILSVLRGLGSSFDPVRERCLQSREAFDLVAGFRGVISLRFLIWPYARLLSLKVNDQWVLRKGKVLSEETLLPGGSSYTPFEIKNLEIGQYLFVFSHPDFGSREVFFDGRSLRNGKRYFCSGSLSDLKSISIRDVP